MYYNCVAGEDYEEKVEEVTLSPSISEECILVVVMNDSILEDTEYLTVSLSTLTEGVRVELTQENVDISIIDSTGRKFYIYFCMHDVCIMCNKTTHEH